MGGAGANCEALHEALQQLAAIVEGADDAIIGKSLDGTIRSWNPAAERLYGYPAAEVIGRPITIVAPPDRPDEIPGILARVARGERVERLETVRQARDGHLVEVSLSVSPIRDRSGNITGASTIAHEITARRRADAQFRALMEAAPDAMVIVDQGGMIQLVNHQSELLFGYDRAELVGQPVERLVPETLRIVHAAHREGYLAHPTNRPMGVGLDLVARRKDGGEFPVEISLSSLPTPDGLVVLAAVSDVTTRRQTEAALERANESMRLFVATASHDLRTPLASALGFAELLNQPEAELSAPQRAEFVAAIVAATRRMSRLVDDLLTVSKIQANRVEVRPERVVLGPAIAAVVAESAPDATVTGDDQVTARVDPDHLHRMLTNYLSNAVRYGAPPIEVSVAGAGERIEIRVLDAGQGVPPEFVDRLFNSFARASHGKPGGTGLGLSIVKGLAEANRGEAFYHPRPSGGSCFGLRLERDPLVSTTTPPARLKVLLVVEDEPDLQLLIRILFGRDSAFELDGQATTAAAAIRLADDHHPHLIVLDNQLDDQMTGLDAAPLLKKVAPAAVVIMFSASEEARIPALDSPAIDGFVLKTDIDHLVPMARQLLRLPAA